MIEGGAVDLPEPRDEFIARLTRSTSAEIAEYGEVRDVVDLFANTPLAVLDNEENSQDVVISGKMVRRRRVILVAGRRDD